MDSVKILILCSGRFALPSMRDIFYSNQLAAVCIPAYCEELLEEVQLILATKQIPVLKLSKNNFEDEIKTAIKKYNINLGFVLTFPYKISLALAECVTKGLFNVHPASLPEYRGADPIFQQIKNREQHAGVTIHKLSQKMDAGDIIIKEMIKTDPQDTYGILNNKLAELAAKLTGIVIRMAGFDIPIPSRPQDESKATYFKKQTSNDITIKWQEMNAPTIIALVNACNPWNKGAVTKLNNKIIRIITAKQIACETFHLQKTLPGIITEIKEDGLTVSTINNASIKIGFIYIDEGFFNASRLSELGFSAGCCFQSVE